MFETAKEKREIVRQCKSSLLTIKELYEILDFSDDKLMKIFLEENKEFVVCASKKSRFFRASFFLNFNIDLRKKGVKND